MSGVNIIALGYNYEHIEGSGYMRVLLNTEYQLDGQLSPGELSFPSGSNYRLRLGNAVSLGGNPSCVFKASYFILKDVYGITRGMYISVLITSRFKEDVSQ